MNSKVLFCFVLMFAVALATIGNYDYGGYNRMPYYGRSYYGGYRGGHGGGIYGYNNRPIYYRSYRHYKPYYHRRRNYYGKYQRLYMGY